jgi:hypothetical protein
MWSRVLTAVLASCVLFPGMAGVLIPPDSTWRYQKGTSEASSPDAAAWRQLGFDDSTWSSGQAAPLDPDVESGR